MPRIAYIEKNFRGPSLDLIDQANTLMREMAADGFDLTLRQLYYQLVARAIIPNSQKEYKNLGRLINDARLAGLVDWNFIVDRTRNLKALTHWGSPAEIINATYWSYKIDRWKRQEYRPEVWIEKDALVGVISKVCNDLDVPYFSCRGYPSQSEVWRAGRRLGRRAGEHTPIILHLGDHDPSGMDMTRDIFDRMELFMGGMEVKRLALNYDQIEKYDPPPNPAKLSDSRGAAYVMEFGYSSWELDALDPKVMGEIIRDAVMNLVDLDIWEEDLEREEEEKRILKATADRWQDVVKFLTE